MSKELTPNLQGLSNEIVFLEDKQVVALIDFDADDYVYLWFEKGENLMVVGIAKITLVVFKLSAGRFVVAQQNHTGK